MTFSLLIPTWNNLAYLQTLIRSLRQNSEQNNQIIIMINEGQDGTLAWVKEQKDLDYLHSPNNQGICYGLNAIRSLAQGDYLVYFNDDMYACPNWDGYFRQTLAQIGHEDCYLSASMIEPLDTGNPAVLVADYGSRLEDFREADLLAEQGHLSHRDWSGAAWPPSLISKKWWDKVGGMSVEFSPGMYSDPDFAAKLYAAGIRHFQGLGASRVYHFGSKSTLRVKKNRGADTFLMKWGLSAGAFYQHYLRMGQAFEGPLPQENPLSKAQKQKYAWKRRLKAWSDQTIQLD